MSCDLATASVYLSQLKQMHTHTCDLHNEKIWLQGLIRYGINQSVYAEASWKLKSLVIETRDVH